MVAGGGEALFMKRVFLLLPLLVFPVLSAREMPAMPEALSAYVLTPGPEAEGVGVEEGGSAGDLRRLDHGAEDVFGFVGELSGGVFAGAGDHFTAVWMERRAGGRIRGADEE